MVDHDFKFTSEDAEEYRAFVKGWGSCLIVGSSYHKNRDTNSKMERANGIVSDTLRAFANGRTDDLDDHCRSPCSPSTTRRRRWAAT